jgi:hypothetical protein
MTFKWLAAAGFVAATFTSAGPAHADTDPVVFWNQILTQNVTGSPVLTSRTFSMVEVAIFEAVNASTGNTRSSYLGLTATPGDSGAAVARAAHDVLLNILPANGTPQRDAQRANIETQYQNSLAAIPNGAAKSAGINNGALAASSVITLRSADGSTTVSTYAPQNPAVDGRYQLTGPGAPVTPQWGGVTTWGLASGSQFRPGPPPDIAGAEFAAALAEVQLIGASNSAVRTQFQTDSAQYWASAAGTGLAPWITGAVAAADGKGLSTLDYAAMFAALTTNVADATIGIFDAKYTYDFWRPITAIHDADPTSTWTSLIAAPLHPSYVSGHSGVGAAAADTLSFYLGADTDICFSGFSCFDSFALAAQNGADSRLWGGIHYSFDNLAGQSLGHEVAAYNLSRGLFQAVPEPATWATMLIGFGVMGAALRRRPKVATRIRFA